MDGVVGLISHSNWMEKKEKERKGNRGERGGCARPAVWGGGRLILTGHDFTVFFSFPLPPCQKTVGTRWVVVVYRGGDVSVSPQ